VVAVGAGRAILGALPGKDPLRAHEAGDAVAPSCAAERTREPWAAVGLTTVGKLLADAFAQAGVLHLPRSGLATPLFPVVITAARDQHGFAQPSHLILAAHLFDPGIPLGGTSERMPSDFFRTSRCSKSLAFSSRNRRFSASSSCLLRTGLRPGLGVSGSRSVRAQQVEQRRADAQLRRHLGRAATARAP
jgi:hypothetical protein